MTTATSEITLAMSRQDGARAAVEMISEGTVRASMLTASGIATTNGPGCFDWNDPAVNIGDVAYAAFCGQCSKGCRHYDYVMEYGGPEGDWDDDHWNAFLGCFTGVAQMCFGD